MLRLPHFPDNWLTDGGEPYMLATLYSPERFLVLIFVKGRANSKAIVELEGLGQLKDPRTSSRIKFMPFWLVAQCVNQLCYCMPQ
jgi:hypothetical protein